MPLTGASISRTSSHVFPMFHEPTWRDITVHARGRIALLAKENFRSPACRVDDNKFLSRGRSPPNRPAVARNRTRQDWHCAPRSRMIGKELHRSIPAVLLSFANGGDAKHV